MSSLLSYSNCNKFTEQTSKNLWVNTRSKSLYSRSHICLTNSGITDCQISFSSQPQHLVLLALHTDMLVQALSTPMETATPESKGYSVCQTRSWRRLSCGNWKLVWANWSWNLRILWDQIQSRKHCLVSGWTHPLGFMDFWPHRRREVSREQEWSPLSVGLRAGPQCFTSKILLWRSQLDTCGIYNQYYE